VSINRSFIHLNAHTLVTAALALGLALVNVTAVRADSARKLYITEVNPPYDVVDEMSCDGSFRVLITADDKDMDVSQVEVTISGTNAKAAIKRKADKRTANDIFRYPTFKSGYITDPIPAKELCGNGIDLTVFCVKLDDRRCEGVNASCCGARCHNCMCGQCYAQCEQAMRGPDLGTQCLQDCASGQKCQQ
jgi:hypothetical protein